MMESGIFDAILFLHKKVHNSAFLSTEGLSQIGTVPGLFQPALESQILFKVPDPRFTEQCYSDYAQDSSSGFPRTGNLPL